MIAIVAVVAMVILVGVVVLAVMIAIVVLIAMVVSPHVLRGMRNAALEIDTRARRVQAWIECCSSIRTGQGQDQASHHPDDDRSDFHDDLPTRKRVMC
jgi:hypothetical protein